MKTEMDAMEKLYRGMLNIDEMKKRICQIVPALVGLFEQNYLGKTIPNNNGVVLIVASDEIVWEIKCSTSFDKVSDFYIICYRFVDKRKIRLYDSDMKVNSLYSKVVRVIYRNLPGLLESVFSNFPEIKRSCEPFFEAAEVELA